MYPFRALRRLMGVPNSLKEVLATAERMREAVDDLGRKLDRLERDIDEKSTTQSASINDRLDRLQQAADNQSTSFNEKLDRLYETGDNLSASVNERMDRLYETGNNLSTSVNQRLDRVHQAVDTQAASVNGRLHLLQETADNQSTSVNERLDRLCETGENLSASVNERLDRLNEGTDAHFNAVEEKFDRVWKAADNQSTSVNDRLDRLSETADNLAASVNVRLDRLHEAADNQRASANARLDRRDRPKIYIYHIDHEHERTYTENVVEYLVSQGVLWRSITLNADGNRPELQLALDDQATAVLGYNSQLDHSWLGPESFLQVAERRGVPVVQWILDHPSSRWLEFYASTPANSRFLLNSQDDLKYFQMYCLPGALTATTGGVGPNQRSRIAGSTWLTFMRRPFSCMIPLSLHRVRSIEENDAAISALEPPLADAVRDTVGNARSDLSTPLHEQLTAVLAAHNHEVSPQKFHALCQVLEQSVQTFRRLRIFATAQKYPVLIQSDRSATAFVHSSQAMLVTNASMQLTLARMPLCRAVLSVSPSGTMIHDRTMNAINAGCVAIAEDSPASRKVFQHKANALLFRYEDDSLDECLDIVCNQPDRAYEIAQAGMQLRDDPRVRFGQFHNIIELARLPVESGISRMSVSP
jgi:uncharacterized protein YoxC